jgi:hypothetical protein
MIGFVNQVLVLRYKMTGAYVYTVLLVVEVVRKGWMIVSYFQYFSLTGGTFVLLQVPLVSKH